MDKRPKISQHIVYHKDGSLWGKGAMVLDKMHGYWEWFRKDGTKMRSGYFDKGVQSGEWITYDKNGKVHTITQMKTKVSKNLRKCKNGHEFYKTSSCLVCPICEKKKKPETGFLALLSAPARRALENEGLTTLNKLSKKTEKEILQLHGMGPSSMPKLRSVLKKEGLSFKK